MTIQGERFNDDKHGKLNLNQKSLPYDHTRVKLSRPVNGIDYINASWIQTLSRDRAYDELVYNDFLPFSKMAFILAQDPTQDSEPHYLQMIHDQQINFVFHVSSEKPPINWKNVSYGDISKTLLENCDLNDTLLKQKIKICIKDEKTHYVTILTFFGWPENNQFQTSNSSSFLAAITHMRKEIGKKHDTLTIMSHDGNGGIDGASAFVVLFRLLEDVDFALRGTKLQQGQQTADASESINIFETIKELRKKRARMVHSFATYEFLFSTLAFYASNKNQFDEMLTKIDPSGNPNVKPRKTVTRRINATGSRKEEIRTRKDAEEELFGESYSDIDDIDEDTSNTRPTSVTYVYDDDSSKARPSSITYVYEDDKQQNRSPSVSYVNDDY